MGQILAFVFVAAIHLVDSAIKEDRRQDKLDKLEQEAEDKKGVALA